MAMPTGSPLESPLRFGVSSPTRETISMHVAIPRAPTMNRNFRPNRSTVQTALRVKRIPKVALSALIKAMVLGLVKTFL